MRASAGAPLSLAKEHPELYQAATTIIQCLQDLNGALGSVDRASVWAHHVEFTLRASELADHLIGAVELAAGTRYASAYVLLRTSLEHCCLDELLLLAERYREFLKVNDSTYARLRAEYEAGAEEWTSNVVAFERTNKGVSLVRTGHAVKNEDGDVVEQLSPYYPVVEHHDAILGPPASQEALAEAFSDPEQLREWARRNRGLHERYLRWSAILDNLVLNDRLSSRHALELDVHYRFLSAFTHATGTGYGTINRQRGHPSLGSRADHLLGELVLLYVCAIAICELRAFVAFVEVRPKLRLDDRSRLENSCHDVSSAVSYLWFPRLGAPTAYDHFEEANRRAFDGGRARFPFSGALRPEQIPAIEVGYYRDPLRRLARLHEGGSEMTTGFHHSRLW